MRKNVPWHVGLFGLAKNKTNPNQPELEMELSLEDVDIYGRAVFCKNKLYRGGWVVGGMVGESGN